MFEPEAQSHREREIPSKKVKGPEKKVQAENSEEPSD